MIDNIKDKQNIQTTKRINNKTEGHVCNISNREYIELTGVIEVKSFDSKEILLHTKQGTMLIKGDNLHIEQLNLDKGNVEINGKIDAIIYSNKNNQDITTKSVLSRLFG